MSYGATKQVLIAGLSTVDQILEASKNWPDHLQVLHTEIALHAYQFIQANEAYMQQQKEAMDSLTQASQQRIYLHNKIVEWQNALAEWQKAQRIAEPPVETGSPEARLPDEETAV